MPKKPTKAELEARIAQIERTRTGRTIWYAIIFVIIIVLVFSRHHF